jgi:protein translocase SecG subunit
MADKNMPRIINIAEIVVSILLIVSILLQNRGAGLSSTFGGDFGGYYSKRGFEKFLTRFSIFLAIIFIALAITNLFLTNKPV